MTEMKGFDRYETKLDDPVYMAEYERNAALPFPWEEPLPPDYRPAEYTDPLWRCAYCGVSDTALMTCPHCGGPRNWRF